MPETRSGHSYNIMDQGSTIPNPSNPNPNTNTSEASSSFQQQLDKFSQTLNMVMHRLDVIDERSNREVGQPPREARRVPRRREGIGDSGDENEEVQLGGVRHRAVPGQPRDTDVRRNVLDELTRRMKVEVADFCGKLNPDAFFDWVTSLEDYFDWFSVLEEHKVRFVKLKLKGLAHAWWGSVEERLKRTRQAPITEWEDMKERLEAKYLPINYEQLIYEDMLQWSQNNRATVDQYTERFHELTVRSKTNETEPQVLARYLKGLKPDIRKDMLTARLYNVEEAYQLALQLERQTSGNTRRFYSADSGNFRFPTSTSAKPTVETTRGNVNGDVKGKERAFGEGPQCYKCKGRGHFAVVCPTRDQRVAYVCEKDLVFDDDKIDHDEGHIQEEIDSEEERLQATDLPICVIQHVLTGHKTKEDVNHDWKRTNIFHTRVAHGDKALNVIIDNGSSMNVVAKEIVEHLGLSQETHPTPYWRTSEAGLDFAAHMMSVHDEVRQKIALQTEVYAQRANLRKRDKQFEVGDHVLIRLRSERFPPGS
ncbi:hypothetical protein LWI29_031021 [Acer saccharum]|uniref:CCHC-type domain-containing protein n=1 Tax=Acer saccharum TaxID=4024 RepID=A0AA39SZP0_ACESA|nr:hypothetical protein LWI29_031021 [Acer saccharum]